VTNILKEVRESGDDAVRRFTQMFDKVSIENLEVKSAEINAAGDLLPEALKAAINLAKSNIERFHSLQLQHVERLETMPGVNCWRRTVPIEKVGLYIPGGTAPLFSTLLMLAIPAKIAGCSDIVLCSPPNKEKKLHPAILYAASITGISRIFMCGGIQAIGALAYGTRSVPRVNKIFGPGNQYVTCAKQLVQKHGVAIDMPAGPSEVAVFADETADPDFVAADLLSQAEHGADSQVLLVTTSQSLAESVTTAIGRQLEELPRRDLATKALENSKIIVMRDRDDAMALLNEYAPEHLILACDEPGRLAEKVINAGSVFIGHYSPESAGDYASGTNHTLPTNGYAKAYSGVSVDSFVKKITFQELTATGLQNIGPSIEEMAAAEGLFGHKNAVSIRLEKLKQ
jgi:histidinol dehydrogenase